MFFQEHLYIFKKFLKHQVKAAVGINKQIDA